MTERQQEIRQAIVAYFKKYDRCPNFKSVGTDWNEGHPVFDAMRADGTLVDVEVISPKGRKIGHTKLAK